MTGSVLDAIRGEPCPLRLPCRHRIDVVAPGVIDTDLVAHVSDQARAHVMGNTPMRRPGRLDELPPAVQFLASEGASYITGAVLPVSGGTAMGH